MSLALPTSSSSLALPRVDDPQCPGFHAVDGPVGDALVVADGDREPSEVGPHQVDDGPLLALDLERRALATVLGPPFEAWKEQVIKIIR